MALLHKFLVNTKEREKSSYIWNTVAGIMNASLSVILLIVITHTLDINNAGIFTIAYATGTLGLSIGNYGIRNYQVTDVEEKYTFGDYKTGRYISCILMIIFITCYLCYARLVLKYSLYKIVIVILMCFLRCIDTIEDVIHGFYQQHNRLDIAGKALSLRLLGLTLSFTAGCILFRNMFLALLFSFIASLLLFILCTKSSMDEFNKFKERASLIRVKKLLGTCMPLCISAFLILYIGNASKYAIDATCSEAVQAYFGFLSMPIFVIGMLNNFIYQPILVKIALDWNQKNYTRFNKRILKQFLIIMIITILIMVIGYILGTPLLSLLYATDLKQYKLELVLLLFGGGWLAFSGFLSTVLTVMRAQKSILVGYTIVAVLSSMIAPYVVSKFQILGASLLYLGLMILLSTIFSLIYVWLYLKCKRRYDLLLTP